jgi:xanthine dehydrogenase YagR molybdenum-binding subunit
VLAQTAAERLGASVDLVSVELGGSGLPAGPVAGGSNTTASTTSVVIKACDAIRARLFQAAATAKGDVAKAAPASDYALGQGQVYVGGAPVSLDAFFRQMGEGVVEEYAESVPRSLPPEAIGKLYSGRVSMTGGPKGDKLAFAFGAQSWK